VTREYFLSYLSIRGRCGRVAYLKLSVGIVAALMILSTVIPYRQGPVAQVVLALVYACLAIAVTLFGTATTRRLNDIGMRSRYLWVYLTIFALLHLVPAFFVFIGLMTFSLPIIWLLLVSWPGTSDTPQLDH
jgi:uncharacterized membrane protein YhaH (DUF805 family)